MNMKKIIVFATAALLMSGAAFATKGKKSKKDSSCKEKHENCCAEKKSKEAKAHKEAKTAKTVKVS